MYSRSLSRPTRRTGLLALVAAVLFTFLLLHSYQHTPPAGQRAGNAAGVASALYSQPDLSGHAIAPRLGNETIKAELGRAAWKVLHTTLARFPEKPTKDESEALRSYIHLFQRLYPCGECAEHFGEVLKQFPPQVDGRNVAAGWGCHVHNVVNKRLKKPQFDCSKIGDFYDCGCADDEKEKKKGT
ncbi:FAD-dependent thiol oxidase [Trichodelitschia bisporula]|uniref:Sulfhydryl oxidase n=1 Tax=Trichodelitschia bisporula TaxID=703511 RepID=A0A6G1IAR6_9PEZI|nr:FAD-dependent thiol oxidase [Trichodelitschia bisporula]